MTEAGGEKAREEGGNTFILRHTSAKNAKKYLTDVTVLESCFFCSSSHPLRGIENIKCFRERERWGMGGGG